MRINVDDVALRDPDINRRLPRHVGLSRFDAFGRLVHVWGLAYDRRSSVLLMEDVDDVAEHDGFAAGMVLAGIADQVAPDSIRVHGVQDRIAYLVAAADAGKRGGETRAKQAAASGRGPAGKFTKGVTSGPLADGQGSSKGSSTRSLDSSHTSGSSPDLDLISFSPGARGPATAAPGPDETKPRGSAVKLVALAVELMNAARHGIDPAAQPVDADQGDEMAAAGHLLNIPEDRREAAIRHGVAAIAASVKSGRDSIASLRPGELFGPRSWRKWQAAPTEFTARGRDGPAGSRTGQARPAASHGTDLIDPRSL